MNSIIAKKGETVKMVAFSNVVAILDSSFQGESLQRKADMANGTVQCEESSRPNNTGMPDNLKAGVESLSGFSMDDVRVHNNSSKPATVQALAYTQGTDIHVAPGQGECLPHEAWRVAQQMAGRISSTTNINGIPVNDNAALEHEADVKGEKVVQCKMLENDEVIQCKGIECRTVHKFLLNKKKTEIKLMDEESVGGRTIAKHIIERLLAIKRIQNGDEAPASFWNSIDLAEKYVNDFLEENWCSIKNTKNPTTEVCVGSLDENDGCVLYKSLDQKKPNEVKVIVWFDYSPGGIKAYILTAYPSYFGLVPQKYNELANRLFHVYDDYRKKKK